MKYFWSVLALYVLALAVGAYRLNGPTPCAQLRTRCAQASSMDLSTQLGCGMFGVMSLGENLGQEHCAAMLSALDGGTP